MDLERDRFISLKDVLISEPALKELARPGLCRQWTKAALDFFEKIRLNISAEAREVEIEPSLQHTFIRIRGERAYLCDGTGVLDFPPFFGFEDEAPEHLLNSHPDMINSYR
jgi:hypothetical protein